jgi:nucleotide-binding universal stress UspA family protein
MPDRPIVIAFDGSKPAQAAVREAGALLAGHPALIVTIWEAGMAYVAGVPATLDIPATPVDVETAHEIDDAMDNRAHRLAEQGAQLAREAGFAAAEPLVVADESNVAETIVEVARSRDAGAIVVGSRGLSGLKARFAGSVSKHVLEHADRPVLVVHE